MFSPSKLRDVAFNRHGLWRGHRRIGVPDLERALDTIGGSPGRYQLLTR
jgi:hypothetical protein